MWEVETDRKRVLLEPADGKSFKKLGNGLYLRNEGKFMTEKGLLLGPQSHFKKILNFNFRYATYIEIL